MKHCSNLESAELPSPSETTPVFEPPGLNLTAVPRVHAAPLDQTKPDDAITDATPLAAEDVLQQLEEHLKPICMQEMCLNSFTHPSFEGFLAC